MIGWLIRRLRPWEGWDTFLPLSAVALCLPAAVADAEWIPGDVGLLPLVFFALLLGAPSGLLAALGVAAHTLPVPPWSSEAVSDLAMRWLVWLKAAAGGGASNDPDIFLFYVALLCWLAVLLVAWAFYRRQRPLLALLPSLALTALVVFYSDQGIGWLIGELGCGILLLALGNLIRARRAWEATGVDYAPGLNFDVLLTGGAIACVVALFSLLGPQFSARRISDWFWRTFETPSARVEETMDRLFGGVSLSGERPGGEGEARASSYMPQSRLLGGRPELLDEVVMVVQTDETPSLPSADLPIPEREVPRHYWRGVTLDHYTGRGWVIKVDFRENVEGELSLLAPPDYREVTQHFEFTAHHGDTLYALNAPVWVGGTVKAVWRGPGDLARLASEVTSYTIVSRLPMPTANDLRAVPPVYSDEISERLSAADRRYLQLPETVPTRVIELAREVVAEGETVYERARLLERYLRGYPYSLDVERPPEDWDVADYFLFGVREGYCDYYATAFVVMARAVGIPARLASGYVEGRYAPVSNTYLVSGNDAHSWSEVYFPGWGWIRFEPTASRAAPVLPKDVLLSENESPAPTGPPARVVRSRWRRIGLWLGAMVGAWLVAAVWRRHRRRQAARVVTLPLVWDWVGRGGARLGLPPDPALTPQEYAATLAIELHARAERTQRWQSRWLELAEQGEAALEQLAALYTLHVYGGQRAVATDEDATREVWARLSGPLRWLKWLGWVNVERLVVRHEA